MLPNMKTSTYTGTGSAVTVTTGFKPMYVKIWNDTDNDVYWEYFFGMTDAYAKQVLDSGSGTTDISQITSNGVTLSKTGFSAGSSLSESGKTFRYLALGDADGAV